MSDHELRVDIADYLAMLPYEIGYQPGEAHVVIVALTGATRTVTATATWPQQPNDMRAAEELAADLMPLLQHDAHPTTTILVGYGPHGPDRTHALADAIAASTTNPPEALLVHVQDGRFRATIPSYPWTRWHPIGPPPLDLIVDGVPNPAPTREAKLAQYAPLPQPVFNPLPRTEADRLGRLLPSLRAEIAARTLDRLTEQASEHDPAAFAQLAHLISSDLSVRDHLLIHAGHSPERADTLVRLYRSAPAGYRDDLGATAATALYFSGSNLPADAILGHINPSHRLGALTTQIMRTGTPGPRIHAQFDDELTGHLDRADTRHRATQAEAVRQAAYPPAAGHDALSHPQPSANRQMPHNPPGLER